MPSLRRFFSKSEKESPFSILNINSSFLKFTKANEKMKKKKNKIIREKIFTQIL